MKTMLRLAMLGLLISVCSLWYWPQRHAACAGGGESQGCKLVTEALESASKLKVGMLRAEIEKDFELDGGMTFRDKATYTYRRCHHIKVEVEFAQSDGLSTPGTLSPEDQASRISRPYLAYPISD